MNCHEECDKYTKYTVFAVRTEEVRFKENT